MNNTYELVASLAIPLPPGSVWAESRRKLATGTNDPVDSPQGRDALRRAGRLLDTAQCIGPVALNCCSTCTRVENDTTPCHVAIDARLSIIKRVLELPFENLERQAMVRKLQDTGNRYGVLDAQGEPLSKFELTRVDV